MSGLPLIASPGVLNMNYANAKYTLANTQTQANANDCDNGSNCAINSPQTQGDGTANSPTNLQISKFNRVEPPVDFGLQFPVKLLACRGVSCLIQEPNFFNRWIINCPFSDRGTDFCPNHKLQIGNYL